MRSTLFILAALTVAPPASAQEVIDSVLTGRSFGFAIAGVMGESISTDARNSGQAATETLEFEVACAAYR